MLFVMIVLVHTKIFFALQHITSDCIYVLHWAWFDYRHNLL